VKMCGYAQDLHKLDVKHFQQFVILIPSTLHLVNPIPCFYCTADQYPSGSCCKQVALES
jgi:hypothetical protein